MFKHVFLNLLQRPARTLVSALAISLGVVLILISVGLSYGQMNDSAERTRRVGGDFMVQPSGASLFFALNSGTLPVKIQRVLEEIEGIAAATPVLTKFLSDEFHLVYGIEPESFQKVNDSLDLVEGRLFEAPNEVLIDTIYARTRELSVRDEVEFLNRQFVVSGIFEQGTGARVLMPLNSLQEMNGTPDKATLFFVRASEDFPRDKAYELLQSRLANYKVTRTEEILQIMAATTPVFKQFLSAMVFVAVAISFLIILLVMYSTITERTREIGILKSLGASRNYIIRLILKESLLICAAGAGIGFVLTFIATQLILFTFPSVPVTIPAFWKLAALFMAVGGGALGALYPAFKAAQLDPLKALGYE